MVLPCSSPNTPFFDRSKAYSTSTNRKFRVSVVFAVGIFACIACVVRLYYSVKLTQSEDATWRIEPVGSWALAEFTTVILVACFPVLPRSFIELRNRNTAAHYELSDTPEESKRGFSRRRGMDTTGREQWRSPVGSRRMLGLRALGYMLRRASEVGKRGCHGTILGLGAEHRPKETLYIN
ncbi:hypothetical protein F5X98DRAFT_239026 [Xylaria grammica]|nr:hypothetical protein F5X98DRAFT_239026 [Xylaria grammica]